MSAHSRVHDLIEIIMNSVAQEADIPTDYLSVEIESVITRGVMEAYGRGKEDGQEAERHRSENRYERDTEPPPGTPPRGTPKPQPPYRTSMYPMPAGAAGPTAPPPRRSRHPTQVFGSDPPPKKKRRVPTPRPRRYYDPRREPDDED
jgi:hypothetical protein